MGTSKKRYIELHGEEAWAAKSEYHRDEHAAYCKQWREANKEKQAAYYKQYRECHRDEHAARCKRWREKNKEECAAYRESHKEERAAYNKLYNEAHKEERSAYGKQYYESNKDTILERQKQYQNAHKEELDEYRKQYYQANKEELDEYRKQWRSTKQGRASNMSSRYKSFDQQKGFSTDQNISSDWIVENIFSGQSCIYCGDSDWTHLGADRTDASKPHTPDNVVCSCGLCNMERSDKYTVEEFIEYRKLHPRSLDLGPEKSWEIVEMKGIKVIKKKNV